MGHCCNSHWHRSPVDWCYSYHGSCKKLVSQMSVVMYEVICIIVGLLQASNKRATGKRESGAGYTWRRNPKCKQCRKRVDFGEMHPILLYRQIKSDFIHRAFQ